MNGEFRDNVVMITGASSGIGEQMAVQLAGQGAKLALVARRADELERVVRACQTAGASTGGTAIAVPADLTDPNACAAAVATTVAHYGRLDTLVNNAGLGMWARVDEVQDLRVFERVMQVNYFGAVYTTAAALPHLRARRGRIVCVSSLAGRTGVPMRSGYAASKHAMNGFFDSLRIELEGTGVTVTIVNPGFVGTGVQGRNLNASGVPLGFVPIDLNAAMTPSVCAQHVLQAAAARKRELVMTARGKIGMWLKLFAPALIDRIAAKAISRGK
ncbi:MAG: SDR family oxidoreductase [Gemmatimonadetes bacterium]|nr:SDR family oxidoreductase [Gemmatimonadota bacterium]